MVYVNLILVYIVIYFENNGNLRRKGNPLDPASVVPHRKKSGPRSGDRFSSLLFISAGYSSDAVF